MLDIYQEIAKIAAEGRSAALVTVITADRSTPRDVGAKMLVRPDGSIVGSIGGGSVEALLIKKAISVMSEGIPCRHHISLVPGAEPGMICGGEMEVFIEPILPMPTMFIFGGGHIALTLSRVGRMLDFNIVVIDDRKDYANYDRFPDASMVLSEDIDTAFSKLKVNESSYIVIVTRGHKTDEKALELALKTQAKYIGMIGSKTKVKTIFQNLSDRGISQEMLDKVYSPIGLEIHAETPEEVAVSILAELIKVRRAPV